jgi:prepilin-type N-terminal cleavage/methylation domain-containing protein
MSPFKRNGFTLIEVVIAVAIIGLLVSSVGVMMQRLPINTREVRDQDVALKIVHNKIESLRSLGYDALPGNGSFSDTFLASLNSATGTMAFTNFNAKTKQAVVTVSWTGAASTTRSVSLTTLITQNSAFK